MNYKRLQKLLKRGTVLVALAMIFAYLLGVLYVAPTKMPPPTPAERRAYLVRLVEKGLQPQSRLDRFDEENPVFSPEE